MRKLSVFLTLIFLLVSELAFATRCRNSFLDQFKRTRNTLSYSDIETRLADFSSSLLIRKLQAIHIAEYQRYVPGFSGLRHATFAPMWVFGNPEALALLKDSFPDGFRLKKNEDEAEYKTIEDFLNRWASEFSRAGGKLSTKWKDQRKLWIQRLINELGITHQDTHGVPKDAQPVPFERHEEAELSLYPGYDEVVDAFDNVESFQDDFRDEARRQKGLRTPAGKPSQEHARHQLTRDLREQGIPVRGQPKPFKQQDKITSAQTDFLTAAAARITSDWDPRLPFGPLFAFGTVEGAESHSQNSMQEAETLFRLFRTAENFVDAMRELVRDLEGLEKVEATWEKELLVQCATQLAIDSGGLNSFTRFQADDMHRPFYLEVVHPIFAKGNMSLKELSDKVRARLQNP